MNYAEFKEKFREALQNHFLGRGQVYYDLVRKTNDTDKEAVVVWQFGATVRPMIYLEDMYEGYRQTGDFEKCVKETIRACETIPFIKESRLPKTWESVKCRVHMRVINKNWNQEALKQMPYREYLDLAIVFYVFIKEERGAGCDAAGKQGLHGIVGCGHEDLVGSGPEESERRNFSSRDDGISLRKCVRGNGRPKGRRDIPK